MATFFLASEIEGNVSAATKAFHDTAESLQAFSQLDIDYSTLGKVSLYFNPDLGSEEHIVNFGALLNKSWRHVCVLVGTQPESVKRNKIWSRYRKNIIDNGFGEGQIFSDMMNVYLFSYLQTVGYVADGFFVFQLPLENQIQTAAFAGRMSNMARWAAKHSNRLKLTSEAFLTRSAFEAISVMGDNPLQRRARPGQKAIKRASGATDIQTPAMILPTAASMVVTSR